MIGEMKSQIVDCEATLRSLASLNTATRELLSDSRSWALLRGPWKRAAERELEPRKKWHCQRYPPMQKKGVRYTGREGVAGGEKKEELLFSVFPFPSSTFHYSVDKEAQFI